jgi:RNA polymerase sigma factor (sigma-70 family)
VRGADLDGKSLVERARQGDTDAYADLVREHQKVALRVAYLVTGDSSEAEDVIQEAFVKAYQTLSRFRPGNDFRPWLIRIVTNEAKSRQLSTRRRGLREATWGRRSLTGGAILTPENLVLASERHRYLLAALRQLPSEDQTIIAYRYLLELDEAEVAEVLGRPRGTVKSRLSRALRRLRDSLTDQQIEVLGIGALE